ncbi:MAG: helix-turn-helix domain-containing protein [Janthinobacterium lividum]
MEKLLVSRADAAAALSISLRSLAYLIAHGRLKVRKIGGRTLIAMEDLKRFANRDHKDLLVTAVDPA